MPLRSPADSGAALRRAEPEENPAYRAQRIIDEHGRVLGKRMLRDEEPKVNVFLQPTEDDLKDQRDDGSFVPQFVMLDGTRYEVKIGEENVLPQSVWEAYRTTKKMARIRDPRVFTRQMGDELPVPR